MMQQERQTNQQFSVNVVNIVIKHKDRTLRERQVKARAIPEGFLVDRTLAES